MSRRKLRILVLMHESLVPPPDATHEVALESEWRTEFDVVQNLTELGHEVLPLGVGGELNPIRRAVREIKPHISFNMLEGFDDVPHWDQNVVAYLEIQKMKYTGCNSRGLLLGRDKALTKKLLSFHRIRVADFSVAVRGKRFRRPRRLEFPLFVKSATIDSSIGISQASVVENDEKLQERVQFIHDSIGTDALVETYIEGREIYVGILGNRRLTALPVWELSFANLPEAAHKIATERLKWSDAFQLRNGIMSGPAENLPDALAQKIVRTCKRVYHTLFLSGYARIDLRLTPEGEVYVIEANPNPQIAYGEDFAESAEQAGIEYGALLQRIVNLGLDWEPSLEF
ncbi:MAG: ATP-grasp domain-containing protein [Thermoanaerobaculia bacterium]